MHQEAFPGEDISDRPLPDVTAPFWNWLFDQDPRRQRRAVRGAARGRAMAAAGVIAGLRAAGGLEAAEPPEARGLRRDEVRLLVSDVDADSIEHARFTDLPRWLSAGDLLVVNTSGTMNAAIAAVSRDGEAFELHLSTRLPGGSGRGSAAASGPAPPRCRSRRPRRDDLPAAGRRASDAARAVSRRGLGRRAVASVDRGAPASVGGAPVSRRHGFPIRYGYVTHAWPGSMYQTVFATEPGSAEMPSAGRPFTPELVTRLVSRGVQDRAAAAAHRRRQPGRATKPPYEEYFRVPRLTAERVNAARRAGRRVVAVGTTVVRALETVTDDSGETSPGEGWTRLVITPDRPLRSVTGLITGLHEPRATHLAMLEQRRQRVPAERPCDCGIVASSAAAATCSAPTPRRWTRLSLARVRRLAPDSRLNPTPLDSRRRRCI